MIGGPLARCRQSPAGLRSGPAGGRALIGEVLPFAVCRALPDGDES